MQYTPSIILLLTLLISSAAPARAATVAYWRFENGTAGQEHNGDQDNYYTDSSINGNDLSSWWSGARPAATTDRPFVTTPQTGAANSLALDFDGNDDLGTFGSGTKMIQSHLFSNGWTIEASFKTRNHGWSVIVGKDGNPNPELNAENTGNRGEQPFCFKVRADNGRLEALFTDNRRDFHSINTWKPLELNQWYSVAATYDNTTFKLYLKGPGDSEYKLQGSLTAPAGATFGQWDEYWTVGRGMWKGNPDASFNGIIDEVRISDTALAPSQFLGTN